MKSAAVALQCSGAGAPEVVQHFYQIIFRVGVQLFFRCFLPKFEVLFLKVITCL